jgi:enterochelin esterase-like enzyme
MNGAWSHVDIHGKPADVYEPAAATNPRCGVLHLHGVGLETLVDNAVYTRLFDELQLVCVCPHGQRSWWVDRICPEFDARLTAERYLLDHVVPFFRQRWGLHPGSIGLQGISMGGQGALRLAFRYAKVFPVAAGIASALDFHDWYGYGFTLDEMYDSKEQARQDTALLHIQPNDYPPHLFFCVDPTDTDFYRGNDRLHEKLSALGIPHEIDFTTRAGGHSWDYFNHMADRTIRFVHAGLQQQSRRLL